ncbi:MAG: NAD(P)-binding domain-containing protein [Lysobacteraceae bacterium]
MRPLRDHAHRPVPDRGQARFQEHQSSRGVTHSDFRRAEKVMYRLLDPEQYCGRDVLVVGGGDSAVEAALACAAAGARVTLSYRGDAFNRVKRKNRERLEAAVAQQALSLRLRSEVAAIHPERVTLSGDGSTKDIPNDFVVVCAGGVLPMDLLRAIGIQFETKFGTA